MSALTLAKKLASTRLCKEAAQEMASAAEEAGYLSPNSVRNRVTRIAGILVHTILDSDSAGAGYTAAVEKYDDFASEKSALNTAMARFESIDDYTIVYLAEINALTTVQQVVDWEAETRVWA